MNLVSACNMATVMYGSITWIKTIVSSSYNYSLLLVNEIGVPIDSPTLMMFFGKMSLIHTCLYQHTFSFSFFLFFFKIKIVTLSHNFCTKMKCKYGVCKWVYVINIAIFIVIFHVWFKSHLPPLILPHYLPIKSRKRNNSSKS